MPFPQNEANAMDVVIQFAIHKLGFKISDIVVYAWSIGGFTGRWRREQYTISILICHGCKSCYYVLPLWFCLLLSFTSHISFLSQLGSDVIPRDPVNSVGRLLRRPPASGPQGHAWQLEWVYKLKSSKQIFFFFCLEQAAVFKLNYLLS